MNFQFRYIVTISILISILFCCTQNSEKSINQTISGNINKISIKEIEEIFIDKSEGEFYCFIDSVVLTYDTNYLIVDFIQFFVEEEATKAAIQNGDFWIENGDTIPDINNDYYIKNENKKLRKFIVSRKADITLFPEYNNFQTTQLSDVKFFKTIKSQKNYYQVLLIKYKSGTIYSIKEKFLP